jgi:hypothetical protein
LLLRANEKQKKRAASLGRTGERLYSRGARCSGQRRSSTAELLVYAGQRKGGTAKVLAAQDKGETVQHGCSLTQDIGEAVQKRCLLLRTNEKQYKRATH